MTDSAAVLASEVRRLGDALISSDLAGGEAVRIAEQLASITDSLDDRPRVSKEERLGLHSRVRAYLESGRWPAPPPDGDPVEFDPASIIGGDLNPFGLGARYHREGDEAVGRVIVGSCFEGPPERVHGGIVCALFDEVMGSVFRATGAASAFTGELAVRFEAPAPLGVELEFRARQTGAEGRKRFLQGEAHSADGRFATATATFIEMQL